MKRNEVIAQLQEFTDLLTDIRREKTILERRESAALKIVEGLRELFPDIGELGPNARHVVAASSSVTDDAPRGQAAVRRVLQETGQWLTVQGIASQMRSRGWGPDTANDPDDAVRAAAKRLASKNPGLVRTRRRGNTVEFSMLKDSDAPNGVSRASELFSSTKEVK